MKECAYKVNGGSAHIDFSLPRSQYYHSFKIDTGAFITLIPDSEFKKFFPNKKLEEGKAIQFASASNTPMIGYTHKVLLHIKECNQAKLMNVCFFSGSRALLGMDMIREHFTICFQKDHFSLKIN